MRSSARILTLAAAASTVTATHQGFNYDAKVDGRGKTKEEFAQGFKVAASLEGTNGGYISARIFTTVQVGTDGQPIEAIPAAIDTKTSLLLGIWCSGADNGKASVANELKALQNAAKQYCGKGLEEAVVGISVGSEDLYRNSDMGKKNGPDPGLDAKTLVGYVGEVRDAVKGTCLEKTPIGHVDTWNAYIDPANKPVIEAIDWIGADEYPYFEYQKPNSIEKCKDLFNAAIEKIRAVAEGKEVWVTESGWPVSGKKSGDAEASIENAETYYREVACPLFGKMNVWWYTLQDGVPGNSPNPVFGVLGGQLQTKPLYNLSCDKATKSTKSSSGSKASKTATPSSGSSSDDEDSVSDKGSTTDSKTGSKTGSNNDSSSGSNTGSNSGSNTGSTGSGAGNQGSPAVGAGANGTIAGGAQPSGAIRPGSGSQPGGAANPSETLRAGGSQLSSLAAATVAIFLAVAAL